MFYAPYPSSYVYCSWTISCVATLKAERTVGVKLLVSGSELQQEMLYNLYLAVNHWGAVISSD